MNGRELIDTSNESPLLTDDNGGLENSKKFEKYSFWPKNMKISGFFAIYGLATVIGQHFSVGFPRVFFWLSQKNHSHRFFIFGSNWG